MVLRHLLPRSDERHELLYQQLARASRVVREHPTADSYRVAPAYTTDDLTFPLELSRVVSDWSTFQDVGGRELSFRVVVTRGGFLQWLEGVTPDGADWPSHWSVRPTAVPSVATLVLPDIEEQQALAAAARGRLAQWLRLDETQPRLARSIPRPAATEAQIAAAELRSGFRLPPDLRTFLTITDGIEFGWLRIFGTEDFYPLDDVGLAGVVVAWDADSEDDVVVVVDPSGGDDAVYGVRVHDATPARMSIAPSFAAYLRDVVTNG